MKKYMDLFLTVAVTFTAGLFLNCGESVEGQWGNPQAQTDAYVAPDQGGLPPVACYVAGDCDKQAGKVANCVNGECAYTQITCPEGFMLNALDECVRLPLSCDGVKPKQDACVADVTCNPDNGEWVITPVDCDDLNAATDDVCDPSVGCVHVFTCGGNCMDDDPCTKDTCDPKMGKCVHDAILCPKGYECQKGTCEVKCVDATDCDDFNPCTINKCADGKCQFETFTCDDGKDATADFCQVVGGKKVCTNVPIDCNGSGDDNDPCTVDTCKGGSWKHIPLPCSSGLKCNPATSQCEIIPVAACTNDADCDDSNPCTTDGCVVVNGQATCKNVLVQCDAGQACDAATGKCVDLEGPDCPDGCDDKDPATLDVCEAGLCIHHQPVTCGPGTFLNPESGECEVAVSDPVCEDDGLECVVFEMFGFAAVGVCIEGHWFVQDDCGQVKDGNYCVVGVAGPECKKAPM